MKRISLGLKQVNWFRMKKIMLLYILFEYDFVENRTQVNLHGIDT